MKIITDNCVPWTNFTGLISIMNNGCHRHESATAIEEEILGGSI
jgi:hypothetical protein